MKLKIAVAKSRRDTKLGNVELYWQQIKGDLKDVRRTQESVAEWEAMKKAERDDIKDVGGFVGGYLKGGSRKRGHCVSRSLLTLDADTPSADFVDTLKAQNYAWALYSTHSHTKEKPRYRLVIPIAREVSADEYTPLAMKVAEELGLSNFDPTTYQAERLMYWPSCSSDADFVYKEQDGTFLDPDTVLSRYVDWHDASEWPDVGTAYRSKSQSKQGDPLSKPNFIGAFNRAYTVTEALHEFLSDVYAPGSDEHRFTYVGAETSNGLVVYDSDTFAYSNHATDPACGKLLSAFDLVRIHTFGAKDKNTKADTPIQSLPSTVAMKEWATTLPRVIEEHGKEVRKEIVDTFGEPTNADTDDPLGKNWISDYPLEYEKNGRPKASAKNIGLILEHDRGLKNTVGINDFTGRLDLLRDLPWRKREVVDQWSDSDEANLRIYIEERYRIEAVSKIRDAVDAVALRRRFHPVRDWLDCLEWDKKPRVEKLLCTYLGADDSEYTRIVTRKFLAAAVARIYEPGAKFDSVLLLIGPQGIGKSYLGVKLGGAWFDDSLQSVEGKDAMEQIQGHWIIELAEMEPTRKAEVSAVKQFISKQVDIFRAAYARYTKALPRQCVFLGTTNNKTVLKDSSGNRRFWPVACSGVSARSVSEIDESVRSQIWAEAKEIYEQGEKLYLVDTENELALEKQKEHTEVDPRKGIIQEYLEKELPKNWDALSLDLRRDYLIDGLTYEAGETHKRDTVCVAEIWEECLGKHFADIRRYDSRQITDVLESLEDWERATGTGRRRTGKYGLQVQFERSLI